MTHGGLASDRRRLFLEALAAVRAGQAGPLRAVQEPGDVGAAAGLLAPLAGATDLQVSVGVNADRVDITAMADGREWRVVLTIPSEHPDVITHVWVFERPAPFAGVEGGFLVVVRGPSSAGKTSLISALADIASTPWLRFDDHLLGDVPLRFLIWPDASGPIRAGFLAALPALVATGNQVIAVAPSGSDRVEEQLRWRGLIDTVPHLLVRLDCPADILVERERTRGDRWAGLAGRTAAQADDWAYDLRFDTSRHDPAGAARIVLSQVRERQEGP